MIQTRHALFGGKQPRNGVYPSPLNSFVPINPTCLGCTAYSQLFTVLLIVCCGRPRYVGRRKAASGIPLLAGFWLVPHLGSLQLNNSLLHGDAPSLIVDRYQTNSLNYKVSDWIYVANMTVDSDPRSVSTSCTSDPAMTIQRPQRVSTNLVPNGRPVNGSGVATTYAVLDQPLGSTKHVKVVGIGAGASGINMIRTLRKDLTDYDFTIYEKNDGVGGTWHENRYPGCRCDVPSHNYQFSWRPNPEWSNFHSPAEEIRQYLCRVCEEENMMSSIKLQHQVTGAWWDESRGLWDLNVRNLKTGEEFHDQADFILDGSGILK